jgi:hypothetical protein
MVSPSYDYKATVPRVQKRLQCHCSARAEARRHIHCLKTTAPSCRYPIQFYTTFAPPRNEVREVLQNCPLLVYWTRLSIWHCSQQPQNMYKVRVRLMKTQHGTWTLACLVRLSTWAGTVWCHRVRHLSTILIRLVA